MEWLERSDATIEGAKEFLLDQLGVAEDEVEFEILEEPRAGLFGRQRGQARVRARIVPISPRGKEERKKRPRSKARDASGDTSDDGGGSPAGESSPALAAAPRSNSRDGGDRPPRPRRDENDPPVDPTPFIQPLVGFYEGVVASASLTGEVRVEVEEGELFAFIDGTGLGALIGPRGQLIDALQDLGRTFLQKESQGGSSPRMKLDVGGYRTAKRPILEEFARTVAEDVLATGTARRFEGMGSSDRKAIHDIVNEIEGVETSSAGEDPDRYVVVSPG